MELKIIMADPAGNRTAIVRTPVPAEQRARTATRIMEIPELRAEQVGFEVPPRLGGAGRLEMMGGEFCGNAARSYGFLLCAETQCGARQAPASRPSLAKISLRKERLQKTENSASSLPPHRETVLIEISGHTGLLRVECGPAEDGMDVCACSEGKDTGVSFARMPMPDRLVYSPEGYPMVISEGITHMILEDRDPDPTLVRQLVERYGGQFDAFGLQFLRGGQLVPVVYVPAAGSLVYESSCGSGSLAAAWYLAQKNVQKNEHKNEQSNACQIARTNARNDAGNDPGDKAQKNVQKNVQKNEQMGLQKTGEEGSARETYVYTFREPGGGIRVRLTRGANGIFTGSMGGVVTLEKEICLEI